MSPRYSRLATKFPVLSITGPRQSGKTTTAKQLFPDHNYVLLEHIDEREYAQNDPRGFLKKYRNNNGLIIDEVQYAPQLLSYIQGIVDEEDKPGYFILTGSQNIFSNIGRPSKGTEDGLRASFFDALHYWKNNVIQDASIKGFVIYAGEQEQSREKGEVVSWSNVGDLVSKL